MAIPLVQSIGIQPKNLRQFVEHTPAPCRGFDFLNSAFAAAVPLTIEGIVEREIIYFKPKIFACTNIAHLVGEKIQVFEIFNVSAGFRSKKPGSTPHFRITARRGRKNPLTLSTIILCLKCLLRFHACRHVLARISKWEKPVIDPHCHSSSILIERPAEFAFDLMSDGIKQGQWAWGSADRKEVEPGLFQGTSTFTGKQTFVRLHVDWQRLQVDYEVGPARDVLQFRNMSRVIPGPVLRMQPDQCVVSLLTWRLATQSDAEWIQFGTIHEAEMFLIKGLLERA